MYVFENVLYVSTHCIFWIFEKRTVREYLPYTSNKRKSLKNEKSFVRSRISQENIQSKILHLSSHFCSQLSSTNVLHKSFESCIFAWVCLHRNYILLQLLEVCAFYYGQKFLPSTTKITRKQTVKLNHQFCSRLPLFDFLVPNPAEGLIWNVNRKQRLFLRFSQ